MQSQFHGSMALSMHFETTITLHKSIAPCYTKCSVYIPPHFLQEFLQDLVCSEQHDARFRVHDAVHECPVADASTFLKHFNKQQFYMQ